MHLSPAPEENIDVLSLSVSPTPSLDSTNSQVSTNSQEETPKVVKQFYCQRCTNHGVYSIRKGHKPFCRWANCPCKACRMIETRRQVSSRLPKAHVRSPTLTIVNGQKMRAPKCNRCLAHDVINRLRGHKKATCPFENCPCDVCANVGERRKVMSEQIKLRRTQGKERERGLLQDTTNGQQIETNHNYGGDGKNVEEQLAPSPPLLAPKPVLPLTAALMNGMSAMSLSPPLALTTSPPPPILLPASQMMSSFSSMPASFSEFSAISSVFAPQPIQSMPTSPWTDQEMYSYLVQSKLTPQLTQTVPQFYPTPFINPDLGSLMSLLSYTNLCFPSHN